MAKSAAVVGTELGPSKNNMGLPLTDVAALAEREQLAEEQAMDAMLAQGTESYESFLSTFPALRRSLLEQVSNSARRPW